MKKKEDEVPTEDGRKKDDNGLYNVKTGEKLLAAKDGYAVILTGQGGLSLRIVSSATANMKVMSKTCLLVLTDGDIDVNPTPSADNDFQFKVEKPMTPMLVQSGGKGTYEIKTLKQIVHDSKAQSLYQHSPSPFPEKGVVPPTLSLKKVTVFKPKEQAVATFKAMLQSAKASNKVELLWRVAVQKDGKVTPNGIAITTAKQAMHRSSLLETLQHSV